MKAPRGKLALLPGSRACRVTQDVVRCFLTSNVDTLPPQQFGIWLDSSSPEQTVPYLWSEESPASKPHEASPVVFILDQSVQLGFAA